ncbi:MAG: L,D-transpeptidase family protein [Thermodesulfobacteriota bacterium]
MRKALQTVGMLFGCWLVLWGCTTAPAKKIATLPELRPPVPDTAEARYRNPAHHQPLPQVLADPLIEIHKSRKTLYLFEGDKLWRAYPVLVGQNPVDDKVRRGDACTPEGKFYICQKNPRSKYHLSLGLSYPNIEHAERGLRDRLIDERQYDSIVRSITQGRIPPANTALGGEIFIHGDGEYWQWTYGCVALRNKDIEELYQVIKVGTEVIIRK